MQLTRRQTLGLAGSAAALAMTGFQVTPVFASAEDATKHIMEFTGGKEPTAG